MRTFGVYLESDSPGTLTDRRPAPGTATDDGEPVITMEEWQRRRAIVARRANPHNPDLPDVLPEGLYVEGGTTKRGRPRREPDARNQLECTQCHKRLDVSEFDRSKYGGWTASCKTCRRNRMKRYMRERKGR